MKKIYLLIALIALVIAAAVGAQVLFKHRAAQKSKLIGVAFPDDYLPRWRKDAAAIEAAAQLLGHRILVAMAQGTQELQNAQIENMIAQKVDMLIVCSIDENINAVLAKAAKNNIPILAYDRLTVGCPDVDFYTTFDNNRVGVLQGEALEQGLDLPNADAKNPKTIVLFGGSATDNNARFFYDGAMSVLGPYLKTGALVAIGAAPKNSTDPQFPDICIAGYDPLSTNLKMTEILQNEAKDQTIDAVLTPNDVMARAVIEACLSEEKYWGKMPLITGQDADFASMLMIKNGQQLMTVFKDTTKLAQVAIKIADAQLRGKVPFIPNVRLATGMNATFGDAGVKTISTYLLEPVPVSRSDFSVPLAADFYVPEEIRQLQE